MFFLEKVAPPLICLMVVSEWLVSLRGGHDVEQNPQRPSPLTYSRSGMLTLVGHQNLPECGSLAHSSDITPPNLNGRMQREFGSTLSFVVMHCFLVKVMGSSTAK